MIHATMTASLFSVLLLACFLGTLGDEVKQSRKLLLKDADLSKYRGVRIATNQGIITLGEKQEIKLFR